MAITYCFGPSNDDFTIVLDFKLIFYMHVAIGEIRLPQKIKKVIQFRGLR